MPRARKPGPRENRSDLPPTGTPGAQPVRLPTGQPYGQRAQAAAAQGSIPLPDRSTEAMLAGGGAAPAGDAAAQGVASEDNPLAAFLAAAQAAPSPGEGLLSAPTTRQAEPLTAGMDIGAGPGSDAVAPVVGGTGPDPSIILWAQQLPALSVLAAQPGSSPQIRQWVRRIRSQLPPDYYQTTET